MPHPSSSPVRILKEPFLNFDKFTSFFLFLVIPDERIADTFTDLGIDANTGVKKLQCWEWYQ
jgi:hypothetical protein